MIGFTPVTTGVRGDVGRKWFIYQRRPQHVPYLAWRQKTPGTRRSHYTWLERIKGIENTFADAPIGTALVELVLPFARKRHWRWSTIATNMAQIEGALRELPLYSTCRTGYDMKKDPVWAAATRRAQHCARTANGSSRLAIPVDKQTYKQLTKKIKDPRTRLYADLMWAMAGRAGDVRQLRGDDIELGNVGPSASQSRF